MDKLKYIPGDLVMTNGIPIGTKKGIVYQVTESDADKSAKVKDGNTFTELKGSVTLSNIKGKTIHDEGFLFCDCGAWVKDIVPVPLTPEILSANSFKIVRKDESGALYFKEGLGIDIVASYVRNCYDICISGNKILKGIEYCHQLQHFLFGLGINHEMEV